jgi:hypothetical protein
LLEGKAQGGGRQAPKNVLTVKKGRFLAVLAGKRGFCADKIAFFLAFFHFFVFFYFATRWPSGIFNARAARKKIVPENLP